MQDRNEAPVIINQFVARVADFEMSVQDYRK